VEEPGRLAVACEEAVIRYGPTIAVDGLSFSADRGQVVALLGPNGAGKTSTVEALEGYRRLDAGRVAVLGLDPRRDRAALVASLGVMLQRGGVYPSLDADRLVRLFAAYYERAEDTDALIERTGLAAVRRTPWRRLSGGEQQRVALALALVGKPDVLFLDEPTAGVDPEGRIAVRDLVAEQRELGRCVVLTTHELTEAERLADRVVIIDHGRALAEGSPAELAAGASDGSIRFATEPRLDTASLAESVGTGTTVAEEGPGSYCMHAPDGVPSPAAIASLTAWLAERDLSLRDLRTGRSLEEAYLAITGSAKDADPAQQPPSGVGPAGGRQGGRAGGQQGGRAGRRQGARWVGGSTGRAHDGAGPRGTRMRPLTAQLRAELTMIAGNGETIFLTLGIPVLFLLFFSGVHVLPTGTPHPVDFLVPGIVALAVMSTSMTALGIGTGFDRGYGVLKRLGTTPLGRPRLLAAKIASIVAVELVQAAVLLPVGYALGWNPGGPGGPDGGVAAGAAAAAVVLGTIAFGGIGLLLAGRLKPLVNLAVVNALFVVLLLLGGMLIPLGKLPGWLAGISKVLPASALADALHASLGRGAAVSVHDWVVLAVWAVAAPVAAGLTFLWE
jgi:ABC-2 type transport system ATP-binding protein